MSAPATIRFRRIRAGWYAHADWRAYWDGDLWIIANRNGANWMTNTRTLREARQYIAEQVAA